MDATSTSTDNVVLADINPKTGWAKLSINRPKALHALNIDIIKSLQTHLDAIAKDDAIKAVWLQSTSGKAFCAGGDVRYIRECVLNNEPNKGNAFFEHEYKLDLTLHNFAKPIVVWAEGYVMGGGMGLLMASDFRIATPTTKMAMPEVAIGLFPDVAGSRFLAERGDLGLLLSMTGCMVNVADCLALQFATHVTDHNADAVFSTLSDIEWQKNNNSHKLIANALAGFHTAKHSTHGDMLSALTEIEAMNLGKDFAKDYQNIMALSESANPWLQKASANILAASPTSVALSWLLWQWAQRFYGTKAGNPTHSWNAVFNLEKQIGQWQIRHADFAEGVRTRLVDKDFNPTWETGELNINAISQINDIITELPTTDDALWQEILTTYGVSGV